ncbi:hypothetical protein PCASD_25049 [Puccinia coronata f. sp. avenae]|uniref:HSF-type DNA-binding domain-containing protein n=1 Tax=Puccinia coronata f. sp. avenae TaxID=200324 RepID=A0A2N5S1U3_9BASI|nr:hypothetical protein PCASD_25049 [Puccinia coronata f. sp. avenae]
MNDAERTTAAILSSKVVSSFSTRNKAALSISTQQPRLAAHSSPEPSSPSSIGSSSRAPAQCHAHTAPARLPSPSSQLANGNPSSSSVGPNVAGRIGVGGNVMVDPYNPSTLSHKAGVGAGAFVYKVYNMLLDPSFQHLISFNPNGQSFTVNNVQDFSKTVLPKHFKHNNFSSFVRQLNMYGFHKVNKTPRGQRGNDNSAAWEFVHPKFHRGRTDLLDQIRRKTLDNDTVNSQSLRGKDQSHIINQASPTTQRFPLDNVSFLPSAPRPHPNFQLIPAHTGLFLPPLPQRSQSDCQPESSAAAAATNFNLPDLSNSPLPSSTLFEGAPNPTIASNNTDHSLNHEFQPPRQYTHSFTQSPYPIDPPSSSHSHVSSAPITPLSAVPPPSSPMDMNMDPKAFANNPLETLAEMKNHLSNRFQGINASYEALYRELHETCRRQAVLIDLVEKMYKTLQSNTNVAYEFPSRELLGTDTTPIFKITEHNHPGHYPMVYEDVNTQKHGSVVTSPSVSEFSHAARTSPCHSAYGPLSIGPGGFGGFGNLTLASYPNSPAGGLMNDQQQLTGGNNKTAPSSPPGAMMLPSRSVSLQQQSQPGSSGLMDDGTNRFLVPTLSSSHHPQQTPLPPSPAPFKQMQAATGQVDMVPKQHTDGYQQALDSFIHHHHPTLSMMGAGGLEDPTGSFPGPSSMETNHMSMKTDDCGGSKPGTAAGRSTSFDGLVVGPSSDTCIFSYSTSPPPPIHGHHHPMQHQQHHQHQPQRHPHHRSSQSCHLLHPSEDNAIAVCLAPTSDVCLSSSNNNLSSLSHTPNPLMSPSSSSFKGKKRPASGSIDLSSGHTHSHHMNPRN